MDLAGLTRPAILCQCSRCSSSLAVLENEWAKLSNAYSLATAWLSVNFNRISISPDKKQIPQTPDMHLLRGRTTQEVTCKLCQQKLGALCTLDNGPNIFWKMSRVAFREVVTMRTAEPLFKEGALERFLCPPKEPSHQDFDFPTEGALVPSGASGSPMATADPAMKQHMQHQGRSIDQISNSVNHLQDTMTDLKHSFTELRIELHGNTNHVGENGNLHSHGFDMITTVLKELKSKSDEIEKLKLEIEALKLKNRFMETREPQNLDYLHTGHSTLPEVQSPGLLQAGRKRTWPDAFPHGAARTVADSFGEEDMIDDLPLANAPTYLVRLPIKNSNFPSSSQNQQQPAPVAPSLQLENHDPNINLSAADEHTDTAQPSPSKRLRITQSAVEPPESATNGEKKRRRAGRPRKSEGQATKSAIDQSPSGPPAGSEEGNESSFSAQVPTSNPITSQPSRGSRGGRVRRSTRSRSILPIEPIDSESTKMDSSVQDGSENGVSGEQESPKNDYASNRIQDNDGTTGEPTLTAEEKRKAKVAARDAMTRRAMQREEAMETDDGR
ncbi:uncharacterized protein N7483_006269 [Penicillium malachiteum]|uniref:uncharacterized protein n=1 Tax=Penicillium malachiteum TaxID=1324776 RepID=UPI002549C0A7|nr:uncharacterized protein N7483_006269 [Penicillium malachiteum]KAJ5731761.1 hypothetical protein N7483_006269 [Penicillium malachiteum]